MITIILALIFGAMTDSRVGWAVLWALIIFQVLVYEPPAEVVSSAVIK